MSRVLLQSINKVFSRTSEYNLLPPCLHGLLQPTKNPSHTAIRNKKTRVKLSRLFLYNPILRDTTLSLAGATSLRPAGPGAEHDVTWQTATERRRTPPNGTGPQFVSSILPLIAPVKYVHHVTKRFGGRPTASCSCLPTLTRALHPTGRLLVVLLFHSSKHTAPSASFFHTTTSIKKCPAAWPHFVCRQQALGTKCHWKSLLYHCHAPVLPLAAPLASSTSPNHPKISITISFSPPTPFSFR